ncbi:insulinase family protein [Ornithobacterium rhinotracheale]|uniref:M16 family metallopeptidase n=1 Tax=Ornithobacterium rhinotracheale TaxID=28251 RepID=UPI00129CE41A|nr:pitrilysin family protein [Ornithobacterium rhinotracheale]MRI63470.1 insulinase family protein [Ornithobacterium rhinotracheale]
MKKVLLGALLAGASLLTNAQKIDYEEYDLSNGLHVILHKDTSAPTVITSVMYHVGAKDERPDRTGFAHFFEHLLFEGTENIKRGEWFKIVSSNGGQVNANTTDDRTYYYEIFPSNNLKLALWMESERMFHPVINQIGVDTQNEVVKEEKRMRVDNQPYGNLFKAVKENMFEKHPYKHTTIGEMEHLDAATLDEFKAFFKKYYIPNNAVLTVAGDFDETQAKKWIQEYFGDIPAGPAIERPHIKEAPFTAQKQAKFYDPNIQAPMYILAFRTPSMKDRDAYVLDMISQILSGGKTARLYKNMVDKNKLALEVASFNYGQEDYGTYLFYGIPIGKTSKEQILKAFEKEIKDLQTNLISEREYQKVENSFENSFVNKNKNISGVASSLATNYMLYGDTSLINKEIEIYRSITREEIREVARKYFNLNQSLILEYLPEQNNDKK